MIQRKIKLCNTFESKETTFVLSVGTFIQEDVIKIKYNPNELQANSRVAMIKKIKADIEFDKMVCELEGYNFTEYLDSLQAVVLLTITHHNHQ